MYRKGRLSVKRKYETKLKKCTELTVSIDIALWNKARTFSLLQQLGQVAIVETLLPPGWLKVGNLAFGIVKTNADGILLLSRCVVFDECMRWHIQVEGKRILPSPSVLASIAECLSTISEFETLLAIVSSCHLCCGNNDEKFLAYISAKKGKIMNAAGTECVAYLDTQYSTIRSTHCELLVEVGATCCAKCKAYRNNLRALVNRYNKQAEVSDKTNPSSHTPFSILSSPDKCIRYALEHKLRKSCQREIAVLRKKLDTDLEVRGTLVDNSFQCS